MLVLLLCDGGGPIGVGHVIRSLALAEAAVAAGHDVVVGGHFEGEFVRDQLAAAQVEVVELAAPMAERDRQLVVDLIRGHRPDVVHVDCYDGPAGFAEVVASAGSELVLSNMEDGSFGRRAADVVIDPTFGAERASRPDDGSTWLLRGSRYAPIRRRVLEARRPFEPGDAAARSVLVVMGGTDPVGLAPAAVRLLAATGLALDVTVIAVDELAERASAAAVGSRLTVNVVPPMDDLAAVMAHQDLVISAAGTSVWELCCIGVPMAIVWAVDNQRGGYDHVVAAGAAVGLGGPDLAGDQTSADLLRAALTDSRVRAGLALSGQRIVDGLGAWRVVRTWEAAQRHALAARIEPGRVDPGLVARPASLQDAQLLWQWRNDADTRAGSRQSEPVAWPDHLAWLESSLTRSDRRLLIAEDGVGPVGTVRWDLEGDGDLERDGDRERQGESERGWQVSITVAPDRRGQSLARPLLHAAEMALTREAAVTAYLAAVHVDNSASVRLFESSGYLPDTPPDRGGFMRFRKSARVT